ncbi:MAG: hypothetical protein FJX25_04995 [Alphaproteobacteria bacterium]|nr:hypothetical protein [Alphaproteobacteria bacterium]
MSLKQTVMLLIPQSRASWKATDSVVAPWGMRLPPIMRRRRDLELPAALPGTALCHPRAMDRAWRATQRLALSVPVHARVAVLAQEAIRVSPGARVAQPLALVLLAVLRRAFVSAGLSVATTRRGHRMEHRPLR